MPFAFDSISPRALRAWLLGGAMALSACSGGGSDDDNPFGGPGPSQGGSNPAVTGGGSGTSVDGGASTGASSGTGSTGSGATGTGSTGSGSNGGSGSTGSGSNGGSGSTGSGSNGVGGSADGGIGGPGATPGGSGGSGAGDAKRVDNPYAGAKGYINPEWQARAKAEPGGDRIANNPTAVWLDRIAAIAGTPNSQSNGPMGLRDHLNAAVSQGAGYVQFVIYNLPGRDCSALASNGELKADELPRYKTDYIDAIAAIMGDAKYRGLRIVNIIEVDSLPNLVTNTDVEKCAQMKQNGAYVQGVAYALQKLGALPNTYNYIDAGHHGWLGWDDNLNGSAQLFAQVGMMAGMQNVHGFITNVSNYSPLKEPFLDPNSSVNGMQLRQAKWIDWNPYVDELSYAQGLRNKLVSLGFDPGIGMLIDTSRNGWGGSARPAAKSSSTDLNTFVDQSRVDRRIHAGNWCNQAGAGLGERPKAAPESGIDAYVWIKPPGESDGASKDIPNSDGKGFDRMCDPTYSGNKRNGNNMTGALPDSPLSGTWFSAQFQELMRNAYPAL